jgi:hypothetical protein
MSRSNERINSDGLTRSQELQSLSRPFGRKCTQDDGIRDSPYYVFVALCIVVIVVSLIKIAASNENIECFREYCVVGNRAPDPSFF